MTISLQGRKFETTQTSENSIELKSGRKLLHAVKNQKVDNLVTVYENSRKNFGFGRKIGDFRTQTNEWVQVKRV